jgi:hypothetical protein
LNVRNALRRRFLLGIMGTHDVAIVLGWMFLGFLAGWALSSLGWKQLGYSAIVAGLSLVYLTIPIGIILG